MPLFIFLGKIFFKILVLFGLGKFLSFYFDGESGAIVADSRPWREKYGWVGKLLVWLFTAASIVTLAIFAFHYLPESTQAALGEYGAVVLSIIKWPLIIATIFGLNWVIYYLHFSSDPRTTWAKSSDADEQAVQNHSSWLGILMLLLHALSQTVPLSETQFDWRLMRSRSPWLGILLALFLNALLLWGVYSQLPEPIQHKISAIFSTPQTPVH